MAARTKPPTLPQYCDLQPIVYNFSEVAQDYDLTTVAGRLAFWAKIRGSGQRNLITYVVLTLANAQFLELNKDIRDTNRHRSRARPKKVAKKLEADIRAGKYDATAGSPFQYNEEGRLINGFTRFLAVTNTGVTIVVKMEGPVTKGAEKHLDTNEPHTSTDRLGRALSLTAEYAVAFRLMLRVIRHGYHGELSVFDDDIDELLFLGDPYKEALLAVYPEVAKSTKRSRKFREPCVVAAFLHAWRYEDKVTRSQFNVRKALLDLVDGTVLYGSAMFKLREDILSLDKPSPETQLRTYFRVLQTLAHYRRYGHKELKAWDRRSSMCSFFDEPILQQEYLVKYPSPGPRKTKS